MQAQLLLRRHTSCHEVAVAACRFEDKLVRPTGHDLLDEVDVARVVANESPD